MDEAIRDATMVGAAAIEPIVTSHLDVRSAVFSKASTLERWRRLALASAKQCRRAVVPAVHAPRPMREWLASATWGLKLILVEPAAEVERTSLRELRRHAAPDSCALMIGPEGGWDAREIEAAVSVGALAVTLGSLTLRADAMALAAGTVIRSVWEDW